jgi:kynurenine formamidase
MFHNPATGKIGAALDSISYGIHDGTNSHLDALCHYALRRDGQLLVFNGHPQDLDENGCKANGIDRMGPGIFTRGVLVDIPLMKGLPWLEPGTPIYASDLEAWEKYSGVRIGSGDAVFVRTGRWARRAKLGPWNAAREAAGLHASAMPWLKQRDIALLGGDGVNDVQPSGVEGAGEAAARPVHTLTIAVLGVPLVDNAYLEDVAKEAAMRKRWEFLTTVQFTRIPGGTATSFNALATF